ncbi:HIT domain-containing protein [Alphaproteobacteria bacterium LSUCC0684]
MSKSYDPENVFAKILNGAIPSSPVDQDETTFSFDDIQPRARVHSLVIPKGAYVDLNDFAARASDEELAGWVRALARVAQKQGVAESGYRVIVNCGPDGNQEVPHLHGHVLGGQPLGAMIRRS